MHIIVLCLHLSIVARPASVARLLVTHGYLCSTATRTMPHRLVSNSFTNMTQQSHSLHYYYSLASDVNTCMALNTCRTYTDNVASSESEDTSSGDEDEWTSLYDRVARASLSFVDKHGWSREAIHAGVNSLGLPGVAHGVMSSGGHDLLKYFEQQCNSELEKYLQTELQPSLFNEEPDKRYVCYSPPVAVGHVSFDHKGTCWQCRLKHIGYPFEVHPKPFRIYIVANYAKQFSNIFCISK